MEFYSALEISSVIKFTFSKKRKKTLENKIENASNKLEF